MIFHHFYCKIFPQIQRRKSWSSRDLWIGGLLQVTDWLTDWKSIISGFSSLHRPTDEWRSLDHFPRWLVQYCWMTSIWILPSGRLACLSQMGRGASNSRTGNWLGRMFSCSLVQQLIAISTLPTNCSPPCETHESLIVRLQLFNYTLSILWHFP